MLGIVSQAKRVRAQMETLARLNLQLAKLEARQKAAALGVAIGLAGLAAVLAFYAIGLLLFAAAVGLNEVLPLWLSLIVVAVVVLVFAAVASLLAARNAKRLSEPSEAVEEIRRTVSTVRTHA